VAVFLAGAFFATLAVTRFAAAASLPVLRAIDAVPCPLVDLWCPPQRAARICRTHPRNN
jgi:hypothetical protein